MKFYCQYLVHLMIFLKQFIATCQLLSFNDFIGDYFDKNLYIKQSITEQAEK